MQDRDETSEDPNAGLNDEKIKELSTTVSETEQKLYQCQVKNENLEMEKALWDVEKQRLAQEHQTDEIIITSLKEQVKVN